MRQLDAVLFDFDGDGGRFLRPDRGELPPHGARGAGRGLCRRGAHAQGGPSRWPSRWRTSRSRDSALPRRALPCLPRATTRLFTTRASRAFPGVEERRCEHCAQRGLPRGIVTSKRHEPTLRGLAVFGFEPLFDVVVGSDDCDGAQAPDPASGAACGRPARRGPGALARTWATARSTYRRATLRAATHVAAAWGMFPEAVLRA